MPEERWLPTGYVFPSGIKAGRLTAAGPSWQIFRAGRLEKALVVRPGLTERWSNSGLLPDSALGSIKFDAAEYRVLYSGPRQRLEPVSDWSSPESKADGLAFALSLRETRRIDQNSPLQDALYSERYSRLLPTWSLTESIDDAVVLGRWLTGGVFVPITARRRVATLLKWLPQCDLDEIVAAADLQGSPVGGPSDESLVEDPVPSRRKVPNVNSNTTHPCEPSEGVSEKEFRLFGRPVLEQFFHEHVIDIVENAERYQVLGIGFPTAIVLHGPPGCGKTYAVERLVEYLDWPMYSIDSNSVGSPYIHETSRKVGEIFDKAMDSAPSMIVIDEMESYLADRQLHESTGLHHVEEVAEFLRRIPEANRRKVLVVGMTNRLEMIDSAILRRGRFDHVVEVGMPSAEEVTELLNCLLAKLPTAPGLAIGETINALTERPLSDAAFVVREAARLAARSGKSIVDQDSLDSAMECLPAKKVSKPRIGFIQD